MADTRLAAFGAGMAGVAAFQVAAAGGVPIGAYTQGGTNPGVLPPFQRALAGVSALTCLGCVGVALDHGGAVDVVPDHVSRTAMRGRDGFPRPHHPGEPGLPIPGGATRHDTDLPDARSLGRIPRDVVTGAGLVSVARASAPWPPRWRGSTPVRTARAFSEIIADLAG